MLNNIVILDLVLALTIVK